MSLTVKLFAICVAALLGAGCMTLSAPAYSPDYETTDRLKSVEIGKMSIGDVQPRDPEASVNKITLRGSSLIPPNGTFASYLESAIRSDLVEMGLYDPGSTTRIGATILQNDIDVSGFGTGYGVMEVKLDVKQEDTRIFEKVYLANIEFESSFAGAVAIPKGQNEYPNLVRALLKKVYEDSAFINAVKK